MRKPHPERIYIVRGTARFRRHVDAHRLAELDAEHWIAAWESEAASRGHNRHRSAFWEDSEAVDRGGPPSVIRLSPPQAVAIIVITMIFALALLFG